jgi:transposase
MNWKLKAESEAMFGEEIEVDESYFGGRRKGKRARGAAGKTPVFGLLKGVERFTPRLSWMLQEPL